MWSMISLKKFYRTKKQKKLKYVLHNVNLQDVVCILFLVGNISYSEELDIIVKSCN